MKRPSEIAKTSERSIQVAIFAWAGLAMVHGFEAAWHFDKTGELPPGPVTPDQFKVPELRWLHAVPNGAAFGDEADKAGRAKRGAMMKMEGLRPGVSDIFWPIPSVNSNGLYIEMKTPVGELSADQREFLKFVRKQGYTAEVRRSWYEAALLIEAHYRQSPSCNKTRM